METRTSSERSVRSVAEALVLGSGAVAVAFGIAAVAHIVFRAVSVLVF